MANMDTIKLCLATQQMMDRILGSNTPGDKRRQTLGFTNALVSAPNTQGFEAINVSGSIPSTTDRILSVYYRNPGLCDAVTPGEADACADTTEATYPYTDTLVEVTQYDHVKIKLGRQTYQDACEGTSQELARKTIDAAYQLMINENRYLIDTFIAVLADYINGDSSIPGSLVEQTIKMFNTSGQPNAMSLFPMRDLYNKLGYTNDTPIVVGGSGLAGWAFAQGIFAGNVDGLDTTKVPLNMPTFVDYEYEARCEVLAADGANRIGTWIPGAVQRLIWHKFFQGSEFRIDQPHITKTTITIDGEVFDYSINNDGCKDHVIVTVGRGYDLFIPPDTAYDGANACERGGIPRIGYIVDCASLDCTDTIKANPPV